jgi:hypothetical protein
MGDRESLPAAGWMTRLPARSRLKGFGLSMSLILLDLKLESVPWLIGAILLMGLGLLVLGVVVVDIRRKLGWTKRAVATAGTVLKSEHGVQEVRANVLVVNEYSHTNYFAQVTASYVTPGDIRQEISGKVWIPDGGKDYFDGDPIEVFYDPRAPAKARLATCWDRRWKGSVISTFFALLLLGCGYALLPARLTETPMPMVAFPAQLGSFKLKAQPDRGTQYDYGDNFGASYVSPDNEEFAYGVTVANSGQATPIETLKVEEKPNSLLYTPNQSVQFNPEYETVSIKISGGKYRIGTSVKSLKAANDLLNNLPYAQLGIPAPPLPVRVLLPPNGATPEPQTAEEQKLEATARGDVYASVGGFFASHLIVTKPRANKLDRSTLMTGVEADQDPGKLAVPLIKVLGEQIRKAGFRQFVIGRTVTQLQP